jgi:plasmid stabilization system protein ParE
MRLVVSPLAADDLQGAYDFISLEHSESADEFLIRISEVLGLLASGLVTGPKVTLRDGRRINAWSLPPYRLYYRVEGAELQLLRVYHQARKPIERRRRRPCRTG